MFLFLYCSQPRAHISLFSFLINSLLISYCISYHLLNYYVSLFFATKTHMRVHKSMNCKPISCNYTPHTYTHRYVPRMINPLFPFVYLFFCYFLIQIQIILVKFFCGGAFLWRPSPYCRAVHGQLS